MCHRNVYDIIEIPLNSRHLGAIGPFVLPTPVVKAEVDQSVVCLVRCVQLPVMGQHVLRESEWVSEWVRGVKIQCLSLVLCLVCRHFEYVGIWECSQNNATDLTNLYLILDIAVKNSFVFFKPPFHWPALPLRWQNWSRSPRSAMDRSTNGIRTAWA